MAKSTVVAGSKSKSHSPATEEWKKGSLRNFYFLDYFYILLEACAHRSLDPFERFVLLKNTHALGESRYKVRVQRSLAPNPVQTGRYRYTFRQVVREAEDYGLVEHVLSEKNLDFVMLTNRGRMFLMTYQTDGPLAFYEQMLAAMEQQSQPFRRLIDSVYKSRAVKRPMLVFPMYSASLLGYPLKRLKTSGDVQEYLHALCQRLTEDNIRFLKTQRDLMEPNRKLIHRLIDSELIGISQSSQFDTTKVNKLQKRVRDHWINYYLKEVYEFDLTLTAFDIMVYRAEQIGIMQATEFFPNFNGRIVYPTAVLAKNSSNENFDDVHRYADEMHLFRHHPKWTGSQDEFVNMLVTSYFELRGRRGVFFVNLLALKELVCYGLRISDLVFEELLNEAYRLNLQGHLKIHISLEVDRLPSETTAMYLKQEPVMVDSKPRNIIGIDVLTRRMSG